MRASKRIGVIVTSAAAAALLAGCDDQGEERVVYSDLQACIEAAATPGDEAECRAAQDKAQQAWAQEAPKFTDQQSCEQQFGNGACQPQQTAGGQSFFMPMLTGFMIGRMLGGGSYAQPVWRDSRGYRYAPSGPLYRDAPGGTASRATVVTPDGRATPMAPSQLADARRGGFGTTGRSYMSAGG